MKGMAALAGAAATETSKTMLKRLKGARRAHDRTWMMLLLIGSPPPPGT
jgi:hypothetical protein